VSSSGAQDAQSLKILGAGRPAGSALHRPARGNRHPAFDRRDGRPFGDRRALRARYRIPHRKVGCDACVKAVIGGAKMTTSAAEAAGPRHWSVSRFGFSWLVAVSLERPRSGLSNCLGSPRILSSQPNFSMGYAAFSDKNFSLPFRGRRSAGTNACGRGHAEEQDRSWGTLNLISDFTTRWSP
jgi:hypothetical protein